MSQLNHIITFPTILDLTANLYVFLSHIYSAVLFYPIGMLLTFYVLGSIFYMVIKASIIIVTFIKTSVYTCGEFGVIWSYFNQYFRHITPLVYFLLDNLSSFILNYSLYSLVFYVKRIQVYIFWLFVILAFC